MDLDPMSTTRCERVRLTGTLKIALPTEQAFLMFTASGERTWAQGWEQLPEPAHR
jgi:hypothetical protein